MWTVAHFCDESSHPLSHYQEIWQIWGLPSEGIEHYRERYHCIVYAYLLRSNRGHLLIETGAVRLSKIIQGIQFSYTQRYNRRFTFREQRLLSRLQAEFLKKFTVIFGNAKSGLRR